MTLIPAQQFALGRPKRGVCAAIKTSSCGCPDAYSCPEAVVGGPRFVGPVLPPEADLLARTGSSQASGDQILADLPRFHSTTAVSLSLESDILDDSRPEGGGLAADTAQRAGQI
jgi:hypothetical protein